MNTFPRTLAEAKDHLAFNCVRPILFEDSDDPEHPYSSGATCFLAKYRDHAFVITARHCLRDRDPETLRVDLKVGRGQFIPLNSCTQTTDDPFGDRGDTDIAILETPLNQYSDSELQVLEAYDLDQQIGREECLKRGYLFFLGHPDKLNFINYDEPCITTQAFLSAANYVGLGDRNDCHWLSFDKPIDLESISGLSGSPIFQFGTDREGFPICNLIGMIMNGGVAAQRVQFISSRAIIPRLEYLVNQHSQDDKNDR